MIDRNDYAGGLAPASIRAACTFLGFADESTRLLVDTATAIAGSPRLRRAALLCAWLVFDSGFPPDEAIDAWPLPASSAGFPPFFDPVVILAGFGRISAEHRRRGIPPEVTRATLRDLDLWVEHHGKKTGAWGAHETPWIARHFTGRLFQLGRLQFELYALQLPFAVFQSRGGDDAAILAEGGRTFREDGQFADADGGVHPGKPHAGRATWRSRFVEDARCWHGSVVDAGGHVRPPMVSLSRDDWRLAALRGDQALAVHIPAAGRFNGPLTREACADSFSRALPVFARQRIAAEPRLLTCVSWMLDPQLALELPTDSNLVSFQRFFRLVPVPGADDRQTLERVFGGPVKDWTRAPRDTSLRRVIAEGVAAGVRWRMGGGVMLPRQTVGHSAGQAVGR